MTELLKRIRCKIDASCLVKGGLNKAGCKVAMTEMPATRLVIDFDKPGSPLATDETRCDYLLVVGGGQRECGWVSVIELKRGQLRAEQIVKQLQAGASFAANLVPSGEAIRFRPVAASGSAPKHERRKLRNKSNMIELHGKREHVRLMSCGAKLVTVLR